MAKKPTTESEPEVEETVEAASPVESQAPPPVEEYKPVADFVRVESAPPPPKIKLTRASHAYYKRMRGLLRGMGRRV
jgi:hypothetical protein